MKKFKIVTNTEDIVSEVQKSLEGGGGLLQKYKVFLPQEGINVLFPLPGTEETDGHFLMTRRGHQMWLNAGGVLDSGCVRKTEQDRFESCPICNYWWENRSTKSEKDANGEKPVDRIYPSNKGVMVVINLTPFVEHEAERRGSDTVMVPISSEIDYDRVEEKLDCFLDENKCDPESEKCKKCFAFNACYQGPQFFTLSKKRIPEFFDKINKIGGKKVRNAKIKIGDGVVSLRGNLSLAWHVLLADALGESKAKKIAKMVSYPIEYTKIIDKTAASKQFGTSYSLDIARTSFLIPTEWQERALNRAPDLAEYCKPISVKEANDNLRTWLKDVSSVSKKPDCFGDSDVFGGDECLEEECKFYKKCKMAIKGGSDSESKFKKMGNGKITIKKNKKREMVDDDWDDDELDQDEEEEIINKLKGKTKNKDETTFEDILDGLVDDDNDDDDLFDDDDDGEVDFDDSDNSGSDDDDDDDDLFDFDDDED